jgi:hypothetical protein
MGVGQQIGGRKGTPPATEKSNHKLDPEKIFCCPQRMKQVNKANLPTFQKLKIVSRVFTISFERNVAFSLPSTT